MRFAAISTMIDPKKRYSQAELLDSLREQVVMAEDMGFEAYWLGEHHFGPHGDGEHPQPDTGRGRPGSPYQADQDWAAGEHRRLVAPAKIGRGPGRS